MRIIQFVDSTNMGGIETHLHILSKTLKKKNISSEIIFWKDYGAHPLEMRLKTDKVRYKKLNGSLQSLIKHLKSNNILIIHTHGYKASIIGKIIGLCMGIKIVSTYHSGDVGTGLVRLYTYIDNLLSRFCTPLSVSKDIAKSLKVKSHIVKNFVPPPLHWKEKTKAQSIGFVGRLSHEKGPDIFVKLAKFFPTIKFHIFGEGEMKKILKNTAPPNCIFHGYVSNMDMIWSQIDFLCMPSRQEGLPMAALESMAQGTPVVASKIGDLPSLITHRNNGLLAEVADIEDFKNKIQEWISLTRKERVTLSCNARKTIENHYSAENEVLKIIEIYQSVTNIPEGREQFDYAP